MSRPTALGEPVENSEHFGARDVRLVAAVHVGKPLGDNGRKVALGTKVLGKWEGAVWEELEAPSQECRPRLGSESVPRLEDPAHDH